MKKTFLGSLLFMLIIIPGISQEFSPIKVEKKGLSTRFYQDEQRLTKKQLSTILSDYSGSAHEFKLARTYGSIGSLMIGTGALIIGASSFISSMRDLEAVNSGSMDLSNNDILPFLIGCGVGLGGIPFVLISNSHFVKSMNLYNSQGKTGRISDMKFDFGLFAGGGKLTITF